VTLLAYLRTQPGRCPHGAHLATQGCADCGAKAKTRLLAAVNDNAAPDFRDRVDAAIRSAAALGQPFSANDLRHVLSDVPGPLVGARFNAAAKAGLIRRVGYVTSTKANTHGHPVAEWIGAVA
jgi:hypothetical protein